jgi:hypothetical protein
MTLGQQQRLFSRLIAEHTLWLYGKGYECTEGDAYRSPRVFGKAGIKKGYGRKNSNHKRRLAKDINLFKDEKWLTRTEDHAISGARWEARHPLCRWGGHYDDGNHYSMEYKGFQ